jgi:hypothetical protein
MRGSGGGPKTKRGKAASSRNALKHGITSTSPVIPEMESEEEWERHLQGFFEYHAPEGYFEEVLVARLANFFWRLNRVTRHEVAVVFTQVARTQADHNAAEAYISGGKKQEPHDDDPSPEEAAALIELEQEVRLAPWTDDLANIMRQETHLHRQWVQTLHELEALQARRRGQPAYLARVDFSGPPAS